MRTYVHTYVRTYVRTCVVPRCDGVQRARAARRTLDGLEPSGAHAVDVSQVRLVDVCEHVAGIGLHGVFQPARSIEPDVTDYVRRVIYLRHAARFVLIVEN